MDGQKKSAKRWITYWEQHQGSVGVRSVWAQMTRGKSRREWEEMSLSTRRKSRMRVKAKESTRWIRSKVKEPTRWKGRRLCQRDRKG